MEFLQVWDTAHVLAGEAGPLCGPVATPRRKASFARGADVLAVYHVSRRNPKMRGYAPPTLDAFGVALVGDLLPDPTEGAQFVFSKSDLAKPAVKALTSKLRLTWQHECRRGLGLYAYR